MWNKWGLVFQGFPASPVWRCLCSLSPQMTEGRHCQVHLLDDRRLELLVQVGVATQDSTSGAPWARGPRQADCSSVLKARDAGLIAEKKELWSQKTWFVCDWKLVTYIQKRWFQSWPWCWVAVDPRHWLYCFESLVGKLDNITLPWKRVMHSAIVQLQDLVQFKYPVS